MDRYRKVIYIYRREGRLPRWLHSFRKLTAPLICGRLITRLQDVRAKYRPVSELGRGAYGLVLCCLEKATGQHVACKAVDVIALLQTRDGPNIIRRLKAEVGVMSYLAGHPNIVHLHNMYESASHIFLVQELCTGGTLKDVFRTAPRAAGEARIAGLFRGVVKSVLHCHQVGARALLYTRIVGT